MSVDIRERNCSHRARVHTKLRAAGFDPKSFPLGRLDDTTDLIEHLIDEGRATLGVIYGITLEEAQKIVGDSCFGFWKVVEKGTGIILASSHDGHNCYWQLHNQVWVFVHEMNDLYKTPAASKIVDLQVH